MEFKDKVKYARLKLYLSQERFAKAIGVTYATVNRWEKGKHNPCLEMQGKFYKFCNENDIHFEEKS